MRFEKDYVTGEWYLWFGEYGWSLNPLIYLGWVWLFVKILWPLWLLLFVGGVGFILGRFT